MNVIIERKLMEKETLSSLYVFNGAFKAFSCKGLEPPWKENQHNISCIPNGVYTVVKELSSKGHAYPHFRVLNVPDRQGILWHAGNYFNNTLGCFLAGDSFGDRNKDGILDVLNSRATLQKLYDMLPDTFQAEYKFKA